MQWFVYWGVFYVVYGILSLRGLDWLQGDLNVLTGLFRRIFLVSNVAKSKTMTCEPEAIRLGISEEIFGQRSVGKGATCRVQMWRRLPCLYFGVEFTAGYMTDQHMRPDGTNPASPSINWYQLPVSQTEKLPQVYELSFPRDTTKCQCPFPGFLGFSHPRSGLHNHFKLLHWRDSILILEDHPSPFFHCERCGCQVPP